MPHRRAGGHSTNSDCFYDCYISTISRLDIVYFITPELSARRIYIRTQGSSDRCIDTQLIQSFAKIPYTVSFRRCKIAFFNWINRYKIYVKRTLLHISFQKLCKLFGSVDRVVFARYQRIFKNCGRRNRNENFR